jgi:hypothetical protein
MRPEVMSARRASIEASREKYAVLPRFAEEDEAIGRVDCRPGPIMVGSKDGSPRLSRDVANLHSPVHAFTVRQLSILSSRVPNKHQRPVDPRAFMKPVSRRELSINL